MASDTTLIIGGGPAGLEAARLIGDLGQKAILVEKRDALGGIPIAEHYAALTHNFRDAEEAMNELIDAAKANPSVSIRTGSEVVECSGAAGDFTVKLAKSGNGVGESIQVGSIIVATGFQHFDPGRETQMYGYYEYDDVITLADAEKMLKENKFVTPSKGTPPQRVCFIQCVGSRDRQIGNEYCSKVCCGISSKQAIEIRQQVPGAKVFIFYIDMRMYGYWENEIYWPAQEKYHVQYVKGIITEIIRKGDHLLIRGEDTTMGRPMEVPMDVVVLAVGMEPSKGTKEVAKILGVKQNKYNFIEVPHDALDPTATSVPGIFVAGAAAGPKDLDDTMAMAGAAAMKAAALIAKKMRVTA
ncbi:MAG: CoB--CoM heterodisulfide reductase iron-sulfur subunit A family protein [Chloroflexi bacterium]|nr:CoB--CoM heterodisulfide reductase iron-sulfur subunit A family protein [Chloroflexota bacterium]MBI5348207.1 CoB--CoM heterodisulfide reductase iron-sulfur subunit A family protein [Chloroflexota bacterium]